MPNEFTVREVSKGYWALFQGETIEYSNPNPAAVYAYGFGMLKTKLQLAEAKIAWLEAELKKAPAPCQS